MNALDKINSNHIPLRAETLLNGIGAGLGTRTASTQGGNIGQQQPGLSSRTPDSLLAPLARLIDTPSSLATVSVDARVLDALARLPGEMPIVAPDDPLCPVPPKLLAPGELPAPTAFANQGATAPATSTSTSTSTSKTGASIDATDTSAASKGSAGKMSAVASAANSNSAGNTNAAADVGAASTLPVASSAFTGLIARALMQSLETSGLFYESHLAQWASGQRPLHTLALEPQSRLAPGKDADTTNRDPLIDDASPSGPHATSGTNGTAGARTAGLANTTTGNANNHAPSHEGLYGNLMRSALASNLAALGSAALSSFSGHDGSGAESTSGVLTHFFQQNSSPSASDTALSTGDASTGAVHPDLVQTVRQQMELLQNPILRWSGEAWPGAKMDWEIERREEKREDGSAWSHGDGVEPSWRMQLQLDLPRMGTVEAELQLVGSRLIARLKAAPDSAAAMLHESDELRRRLAITGLELKSLAVRELPRGETS